MFAFAGGADGGQEYAQDRPCSYALIAMGFPGYNGSPPESAKSIAKHFQHAGFETFALGKWDHTPLPEASGSGPFHHWASGEGFDHFYGFMAADADDYRTLVWNDHRPAETWVNKPGYHLTTDLADRAIENLTSHISIYPDRPFFQFWAPSAMHSPHQVEQKKLYAREMEVFASLAAKAD